MKRFPILLATLLLLMPAGGYAAPAKTVQGVQVTHLFDLRVRQAFLENAFYWTAPEDRQWLRIRTRGGFRVQRHDHTFTLRLANEHRRLQVPEPAEFDWDELVIDQACYDFRPRDDFHFTLGRQNIIWDDGFLLLDASPLDGSRTIYHDALRLRTERYDFFAVVNSERDPLVLAGDLDRSLSDADERALGLRVALGRHSLAAIWKREDDPDGILPTSDIYTLSGRFHFDLPQGYQGLFELALQQQEGVPTTTVDSPITSGRAFALQTHARGPVTDKLELEVGGFHYSGLSDDLRPFRTPWGRWPKWSELYIYTLLSEGGDGRVHVAAWENMSALRAKLSFPLHASIDGRCEIMPLWAPEPDWQSRGLLLKVGLDFRMPRNITGHLVWEALNHGDFHHLPAGADETAHFLRWQLMYTY